MESGKGRNNQINQIVKLEEKNSKYYIRQN